MSRLKKYRIGEAFKSFPANSWNDLVDEVERQQLQLEAIEDTRKPKSKSPVTIQIAWIGDEPLEPGATVRLIRALTDPDLDATAPFHGVKFLADEFAEDGALVDFAITMGPVAAGVTKSGSLTTRTDDNTGTLTMAGGHGITTGQSIIVLWDGGSRTVSAGTVAGNSVAIDGGAGQVLPDAATDVRVVLTAGITEAIMPEAYWARVDVSDEAHTWAGIPSGGTLLESVTAGGLRIIWKPAGTGEKWAIVSLVGGEDRKVAVDPTDRHPRELFGKLANTGTYDPSDHNLVYGQILFDPGDNPDNLLRLYTAKGEGTESEKFRVFELAERKYSTEDAAHVRWLDHELRPNLAEEPQLAFDPMNLWAGAAAGYTPWASEFTRGMRGIAQLWNDRPHSIAGTLTTRTDDDTGVLTLTSGHGVMTGNEVDVYWGEDGEHSRLEMTVGTVSGTTVPIDGGTGDNLPATSTAVHVINKSAALGDPLWKIVAMEGFAEWAVVAYNGSLESWHLVEDAFGGHPWERIRPAQNGVALTIADPAALIGRSPANNEKAVAWISDVDADPPAYQIHGVRNEDRRVATSTSDTTPLELINKLVDGGTYDSETDLIAKIDEIEDGGIKKLRIAYTPGTGGGGGGDGGGVPVLIESTISAASWNEANKRITATVVALKFFQHTTGGQYELATTGETYDTISVDWLDLESLQIPSGARAVGYATKNDFGRYELILEHCRRLPEEE